MKGFSLKTKYPQNYILRRPVRGALILFIFSFVFTLIYHPLSAQRSFYFGFELTMLVYSLSTSAIGGLSIVLLKKIPFFSKIERWTIGKELLSIYLVLQFMGIVIYLLAFAIEPPAIESRWNLATFWDSNKYSFLIYIFPFAYFSAINYKFLFLDFESTESDFPDQKQQGLPVHIRSKLKKESLNFMANEFLFAVSEGNYVVFHLHKDRDTKKIPIRNSIYNIEKQLQDIPFFFRCHRGFIINLNMVESKKGNSSGYLLKMKHTTDTIPVSRKNIKEFDQLMDTSSW